MFRYGNASAGLRLSARFDQSIESSKEAARRYAPGKRRPLDVVRNGSKKNPDAVADYVMRVIKEGRDVRALTAVLDRVYSADEAPVPMPSTLA
jgi:hypothetical protein